MTPSLEHLELAAARTRIVELEAALRLWYDTLPRGNDRHTDHPRGRCINDCAGCMAECALLVLVEKLPALPTDEVTP